MDIRATSLCIGLIVGGLAAFGSGAGCGEADSAGTGGAADGPGSDTGGSEGAGSAEDSTEPYEEKVSVSSGVVGLRSLFFVEPTIQSLIRIDAETSSVSSVDLGSQPTGLAVLPGTDDAVVLARGPSELLWVPGPTETSPGRDVASAVSVPDGYNTITQSPDGTRLILWFDATLGLDAGLGPLQTVSVVHASADTAPTAFSWTVGFEPRAVEFSADGSRAFVIHRQGISVIDVAGVAEDGVATEVAIAPPGVVPPEDLEVHITNDGNYAVVRSVSTPELVSVELNGGALTKFPLPSVPTDLDLVPGGTAVLAALPLSGAIAYIDLALPSDAPGALELVEVPAGPMDFAQVAPTADRAVLYGASSDVEHVYVLELSGLTLAAIPVHKAVRAAAFDPTGAYAVLLHEPVSHPLGVNPSTQERIDAAVDSAHGYSVLLAAAALAKLYVTDAPPQEIAFLPDDQRAFVRVTFDEDTGAPGGAVRSVHLPTLVEAVFPMAARPTGIYPMQPAHRIAVSQAHPSGRITFIDANSGAESSITGFQLNALID